MDAQTQSTELYIKVLGWLHARRKPLVIGVIVAAVLGLAWAVIAYVNAKKEADANAEFFAIPLEDPMRPGQQSPAPLLAVAKEYPGTAAGEHAQALAAEMLFTQGKYPEAYQQFSAFIDEHPDSALIPQAKMGVAACLEAEGKTSDAIQKYHDIILTYPSELSIVSPAKLTLGRLCEESDRPQDALNYYIELARSLSQNPYDPWASEAQERAQLLVSKHPDLLKNLTNAPPGSAASGFSMPSKPGAAPAPKPSAPAAASGQKNPNLLTIPAGSSNAARKP
jgi:predicted negative regulator of RcsB-dependent stress response